MLVLKELPAYEVRKCALSGQYMYGGDWYYEDDITGMAILYEVYHTRKAKQKEENFNYARLIKAQTREEYKEELKRYEKEVLEMNILTDKL